MQLDDLKNIWNDASAQTAKQQKLSSEKIDLMIQKKYAAKIKNIAYPEIIGTVICLSAAVFIGFQFYKLDTTFLQGTGILSILLLLILSAISLLSIRKLNFNNNIDKPHAEILKLFINQKLQFYKFQKINITLSYLLLVTVVILIAKFYNDKDITHNSLFWIFSFCFGYIFLLFYSKLVTKFYNKILRQSEELLQELQP